MNQCFLIGNLTKAPEAKTTPSGVAVTTFSIAVTRRFKRDETDFINIVTWRGLAENCARYLVKGQKVAVSGEIQIRSYDDRDGNRRYVTEIVADNVEFLSKPGQAQDSGARYSGGDDDMPEEWRRDAEARQRMAARAPKETEPDLFTDVDLLDDEDMPF